MKPRSAPLARKTRLVSRKELSPGKRIGRVESGGLKAGRARGETVPASGLKRTGRLPYRSKKTERVYAQTRRPMVAEAVGKPCAIRWDANCRRVAEGLHEILSRGRGGSIVDEANCLPACHYCNGAVSDNPAEAERRGFLLKSGRPSKATPR